MQSFSSDGIKIAYLDQGDPADVPVLLIHGFASNTKTNWISPGWVAFLVESGFRVLSMDNRGHGESEKLYSLGDYGAPLMAEDARRLLDHLGISQAHIMGFSMGARISAFLTMAHPERVTSVVFGGLGVNMIRGMAGTGPIASALEAPSLEDVSNATARTFRAFAERTGSDLKALAACIRSSRAKITEEALSQIVRPVLVAVGSNDVIGGSPHDLANVIPKAEAFVIEETDHMTSVGDKRFKARVREFFEANA